MPFAPAIPFGGLSGFRFLERTYERQFETFNESPDLDREVAYFLEAAEKITTVDQLMADRRVLSVVLAAFGLDEDLDKRAFIRKVIEGGTLDGDAFANRLVEPAYREMSEFLAFGDFGGTLIFENTRLNIVDRYRERQFELSVGDVDLNMRLALNFKREATKIATESAGSSENTGWLRLLGSQPLRAVVEGAFFLPSQFALIDIDQQVEEIKARSINLLGSSSPSELLDPEKLDRVVERFLLRQDALNGQSSASTSGTVALSLLQSSNLGAIGQQNLFASSFI